jgi:hypothetical protein
MSSHEGGCLCGRVRFRVTAAPLGSGYCHCRMCQRNSGAPVVAWVTFPAASFEWIAAKPATFASSAHAVRSFCPRCGSYLAFTNADYPGEVSINTASFDAPEAFPPRKHIFAESRIAWFETADHLPRHRGYGEPGAAGSDEPGAAGSGG